MRRIALLAAAVAMLLFALASAAQAEVVINEDVPVDSMVASCANGGEVVQLGGTAHVLITSTVDEAGNTHDVGRFSYQNVTGVGLDSGDSYVLRGAGNGANNVRPLDSEETTNDGSFTYVSTSRLIHLGEDGQELDDHMFRYTVHITQAENGEVTAQFERYAEYCK